MPDNRITDPRVRDFVAALRTFEQGSDPAALTGLFAPDETVTRLDARGEPGDVQRSGGSIGRSSTSSRPRSPTSSRASTSSRWSGRAPVASPTTGPSPTTGVTIIDLNGLKIVRLRTYYDTAAITSTPTART